MEKKTLLKNIKGITGNIQEQLNNKADIGHTHEGLGGAPEGHTHVTKDITDLQGKLDEKANTSHKHIKSEISDFSHRHNASEIDGIPPAPVTSVAGKTGVVTLDKSDVGLSNVLNYGVSDSVSDPSNTKYATAGAVKQAYDKAVQASQSDGSAACKASTSEKELIGENITVNYTASYDASAFIAYWCPKYSGTATIKIQAKSNVPRPSSVSYEINTAKYNDELKYPNTYGLPRSFESPIGSYVDRGVDPNPILSSTIFDGASSTDYVTINVTKGESVILFLRTFTINSGEKIIIESIHACYDIITSK